MEKRRIRSTKQTFSRDGYNTNSFESKRVPFVGQDLQNDGEKMSSVFRAMESGSARFSIAVRGGTKGVKCFSGLTNRRLPGIVATRTEAFTITYKSVVRAYHSPVAYAVARSSCERQAACVAQLGNQRGKRSYREPYRTKSRHDCSSHLAVKKNRVKLR